jgi:hypothetical protein
LTAGFLAEVAVVLFCVTAALAGTFFEDAGAAVALLEDTTGFFATDFFSTGFFSAGFFATGFFAAGVALGAAAGVFTAVVFAGVFFAGAVALEAEGEVFFAGGVTGVMDAFWGSGFGRDARFVNRSKKPGFFDDGSSVDRAMLHLLHS